MDHGFSVALWNRTEAKVESVIQRAGPSRPLIGTKTLQAFVAALSRPRRILVIITAGASVDEMLEEPSPLLSPDDVVIDGGNSFFVDTQRREEALRTRGVRFVGMGVSGGEEGARYGPSLMPGGARSAYDHLRTILEAIAARIESGPYVTYVGPDGAGHFVKIVHNGIEYGNMQVIAETYDFLRRALGLSTEETAKHLSAWNQGTTASYLIEIADQVLAVADPDTGRPLVEMILDQAGQKSTGKWTARVLSSMKSERVAASALLTIVTKPRIGGDSPDLLMRVRDALDAATICSFAQGMDQLRIASAA